MTLGEGYIRELLVTGETSGRIDNKERRRVLKVGGRENQASERTRMSLSKVIAVTDQPREEERRITGSQQRKNSKREFGWDR